jgi:hypothetical protein
MEGLNLGPVGYSPADFPDADESRPSGSYSMNSGDAIQGVVSLTLTRYLNETTVPTVSPQVSSSNWRKRLREMMVKQNESFLSFLMKPSKEHPIIGPVQAALNRYSMKNDIDIASIKTVKMLCADVSGVADINKEIEECLEKTGKSSLTQMRSQVNSLIEMYKETGERLMDCEQQLRLRLEKMEKIQKRVGTLIELQTNDAIGDLVTAMENYMKISFRDMTIENIYRNLLYLYQKQMLLRDAMQLFKATTDTYEPTCSICLTDPISFAIVPCGHTFCKACSMKMSVDCGICRGKIRERLKLYIS